MQKKRSPKDVIEQWHPEREQAFEKFPLGNELTNVSTLERTPHSARFYKPIREIKDKGKKGLTLHTHSTEGSGGRSLAAFPSSADLKTFLKDDEAKTDVIAQRNKEGEVIGYTILRKKRDYSNEPSELRRKTSIWLYSLATMLLNPQSALDRFARKYDLNYRFVPGRGYHLDLISGSYAKDRESDQERKKSNKLEKAAVTATIIGVVGAILLLSNNLTGSVIGSLNQTFSNIIGVVLFLVGIVGAFLYFKSRKK